MYGFFQCFPSKQIGRQELIKVTYKRVNSTTGSHKQLLKENYKYQGVKQQHGKLYETNRKTNIQQLKRDL